LIRVVDVPRFAQLIVAAVALQAAAAPDWLTLVAPIITPAEKKLFLSLKPEARAKFEEQFWLDKSITAEEYFRRVEYIDANFGSGRPGSGANTDQGRIYLSLGPPSRVMRLPSSRILLPLDIWYYDTVPGVLSTELRLIFFKKNNTGFPKLYSPTLDTFRALLIPQAGVQDTFGPNDDLTENAIRQAITLPPAEDEVISAAANVASGIRYQGNEEILAKVATPSVMLSKSLRADVRSKFIVSHPKLQVLTSVSAYGGVQVDLGFEPTVQRNLDLQVLEGAITVYQNRLRLKFEKPEAVQYMHRLDLLPGSYRIMFAVDGTVHPYDLQVKEETDLGNIVRVDPSTVDESRKTPLEFDGKQMTMTSEGKLAMVVLPHPGKVNWILRQGMQIVWRSSSEGRQIATIELPATGFAGGTYKLEAAFDDDTRSIDYVLGKDPHPSGATILSFNANLAPALRLASVGRQWLLRGRVDAARQSLEASLNAGPTREAKIEMARLEASTGQYDAARNRLNPILSADPKDFEALSVMAFVEASLQDYPVAAELYRRALAVQDSLELRMALAKLPTQ
jgi:GWxTD domain-containing protein